MLRIEMDIVNQPRKVSLRLDFLAAKWCFQQTTCPAIDLVHPLSVGVEQLRPLIADCFRKIIEYRNGAFRHLSRFSHHLYRLDPNQKVKVIFHLAVSIGIHHWCNVLTILLQEVRVVPVFEIDVVSIIPTVVDVIVRIRLQGVSILFHRSTFEP